MWQRIACCVECGTPLDEEEEYYSEGVCPYCGHDDDSTICATKVRAARWVVDYEPSWWRRIFFWETSKGHWEFKK